MRRYKPVCILTALLVCFLWAAGAADLRAQSAFDAPDDATPFIAGFAVFQMNTAGAIYTTVDLHLADPDGTLPGSLKTLAISGPDGFSRSWSGTELNSFYDGDGYFWFEIPGAPVAGTYTVQVTDASDLTATSRDYYGGGAALPLPDTAGMQASGDPLAPTLSWTAPNHPASRLFYRARIYEVSGENQITVWKSNWNYGLITETRVTVPPGIIEAGKAYKWRVEIWDDDWGYAIDQRVNGERIDLVIDNQTPYFQGATVYVRRLADGTVDTAVEAVVNDPDGSLPGSIQSLTVTPPGSGPIDITGSWDSGFSEFWTSAPGTAADGVYAFTVTDTAGLTKTTYDYIQVQPLGRVDATTLRAMGAWPTPTLSWSAPADIGGPTYYRVIIENTLDGSRAWSSGRITNTSLNVPSGRLQSGGSYRWYVRTYDDPYWIVYNNENRSAKVNLNSATVATQPFFTWAAAFQWHDPDQRFTAFALGFNDPHGLPAATVSGPGYTYTFKIEEDYIAAHGQYFYLAPADLAEGVYTFTLTPAGGGNPITTHAYLKTVPDIPAFDEGSVKVSGDPLQPTISWAGIDGYAGQLYYRIYVIDENDNWLYSSGREPRTAATIPFTMTPGATYRFRVEAHDHPDWVTYNARSNSSWFSYTPLGNLPTVSILEPADGRQADDLYRITWSVENAGPDAVVRLFYDMDTTPGGAVEITPPQGLSAGGPSFYDWNVSALGGQWYYIYATIADGDQSSASFSPGTVTIVPDGMPLEYEIANGLDPYNDDAGGDLDGDGLTNFDESILGTAANATNTVAEGARGDVNGDGLVDLADTVAALQSMDGLPVSPVLTADVDGDGRIGGAEAAFALQASAERRTVITTSRDAQGVWYINGPEDAGLFDIFEAMGYAVAVDRLWQAETFRRTGRGTLAEILGPDYLEQDILVRTTGYSDAQLTAGFAALDDEVKAMISGYVAGFNRRIGEIFANPALLPFEFAALANTFQVAPEAILKPWTAEDVLAWSAAMLRNFDPEAQKQGQLDNAELLQVLAALYPENFAYWIMFNDLRWTNDPDALTYIAPGAQAAALRAPMAAFPQIESPDGMPQMGIAARRIGELYRKADENLQKIGAKIRMGSYAWTVAGSKTATGDPMIYSGPQMGFMTPSIILEGSIRAGGLNISGMGIAGLPGIVIGRTPHHAWSMQVGHAHTLDYYFEAPGAVGWDRNETFKVAGQADVTIPVWKSVHGPIINPLPYDPGTYDPGAQGPIVAYKYSHAGREFGTLKAYLDLARAQSMDAFGAAIEDVAVSQHFCYADRDGNIAYWMSGYDPNRTAADYRLPQGFPDFPVGEWLASRRPLSTVRNPAKGYVGGWNNKTSADYPGSANNLSYAFGPAHRAQVIEDYLSTHDNLTFEEVRDLALNIAATDSFGSGGNPWAFVQPWFAAAVDADPTFERQAALALMSGWDGHFVAGGPEQWAAGTDRADAWVLMDAWIREVIRLTFQDELSYVVDSQKGTTLFAKQPTHVLFNALLHGLNPASTIKNGYNWFANANAGAPQTAPAIIVAALDNVLAALGSQPWGVGQRGTIPFVHDMLGQLHSMPFSSRSTYAHVVAMGPEGPVRVESMFPLGPSGDIRVGAGGAPALDARFFSMAPFFDSFNHRAFPLPR